MKKIILILSYLLGVPVYCQEDLAQEGLNELAQSVSLTRGAAPAVLYIGGAVLAVGLIGVIWAVATNKNNAKDYVIGWFVAVLFYLILCSL